MFLALLCYGRKTEIEAKIRWNNLYAAFEWAQ